MSFHNTLSIFDTQANWVLLFSTGVALLTTGIVAWMNKNRKMWNDRVLQFRLQHHEYTTTSAASSSSSTITHQKDVLLIVCPTSGGGMAMRNYETVLTELENNSGDFRRQVEVYVTKSGDDLMALAAEKDLQPYRMIAILSGDSSVFEFVQPVLFLHNGKWPYAPLLHLPGGTGNAMPSEFYNGNLDIQYIIRNATTIRKGAVVKASNEGGCVRYALHNCFGGIHAAMIEWTEDHRALLSVFGDRGWCFGVILAVLGFLLQLPFSKTLNPIVLNVINSDYEGKGVRLGFGVDRFDDKMVVAVGGPYSSKWELINAFVRLFTSGKRLSRDSMEDDDNSSKKEPSAELPYGVTANVCGKWTLPNVGGGHSGRQPYKLHFDGSTALPMEGDSITLEVIPEAIPYYTVARQDNK
jgi:hypothetical protein